MKNRIWNDALCLLGLTAASGTLAQDGQWTSSYSGAQPAAGTERHHRTAWTSTVYGHAGAETSIAARQPSTEALATTNYRYERVPGATNQYQYTWASSYDPGLVTTVAQAKTTPTVRYQWSDGTQSSEEIKATSVVTETTTTTTSVSDGGYRYTESANVQTATPPARVVETTYTEPTTTYRRNFLRRHVWDAYSSRISVKASFSFNIKADFTSRNANILGSPDGGEVTRTYNDGFVAPDDSPTSGETWYFGYDDAPQTPVASPNAVFMNSVDSPTDGELRRDNEVVPGIEVAYEEILGQFRGTGGRRWNFGFSGGFGFSRLNFRDAGNTASIVSITQDRYESVGGGPVPAAPVTGRSKSVANSLIIDEPTPTGGLTADAPGNTGNERTTYTSPATGNVLNKLDGNLFSFQVGPFIEAPITDRLLVVLGGGFGLVLADLDYAFNEAWSLTTPVNSRSDFSRSGSMSSLDLLWGGYARLNLRYEFNEHWAAEVGAQYQHMGSEANSVNGKTANLRMGTVLSVNGGVSYSF